MTRLKNDDDIRRIRDAGLVLADTFALLAEAIEVGVTTFEIDRIAHDYIIKRGGTPAFLGYMDYPASVCASVNHVVIHGIPNAKKLRSGDILSLDLGVNLGGYIADAARSFRIG